MKQRLVLSGLLGLLALTVNCVRDRRVVDSNSAGTASVYNVAPPRKEIIAQNVLACQLAAHYEVEARTTFSPAEPIPASLYLTDSSHVEPRRICAFLVRDETIVEEQSIAAGANDRRQEFDFRFSKAPRPVGAYQIRFVEVARSNGKPVLLARLFLNVE